MINKCLIDLINIVPKYKILHLYTHNLTKFDGYLKLKSILNIDHKMKFLMDKSNKIIEFKFKNIILRDSYRIFPISLKDLCNITPNVGNKMDYNHNLVNLNNILNDFYRIYTYLFNDLKILFNIMKYYFIFFNTKYDINLLKVYNNSNLFFMIYRTKFYHEIPIIKNIVFNMIKSSYYGGNIIFNKGYYENCYYYDVNSLYSYSMKNIMPGKYLYFIDNINTDKFINNDLFGFFNCTIFISNDKINNIVISRDNNGNIIYPTGIIKGLYFSEEATVIKN